MLFKSLFNDLYYMVYEEHPVFMSITTHEIYYKAIIPQPKSIHKTCLHITIVKQKGHYSYLLIMFHGAIEEYNISVGHVNVLIN